MFKIIVASIMLISKKVDACIKDYLKSTASGASHRLGLTANSARPAFFYFFGSQRENDMFTTKNTVV